VCTVGAETGPGLRPNGTHVRSSSRPFTSGMALAAHLQHAVLTAHKTGETWRAMAKQVTRSASVPERLVIAGWVLITALWAAVALWVILHYQGSTDASTWTARLIMLVIAAVATAAVMLVNRAVWRRAMRKPLPRRRSSIWIARRPWWQLAVFYWIILGSPQLAEVGWLAPAQHHGLPGSLQAAILLESMAGASFVALVIRVKLRRQLQNRQLAAS
jgi:hypothetical protein